jgi:DNA-binding transcriptional MocR family regulator
MTIWTPDLSERRGPLYVALADAIASSVEDGTLGDGTRLPPHRDLAHRLGVTVGTVSRAYALAEQRGLVSPEVGRGTFVRRPRPRAGRPSAHEEPPDEIIDLTLNQPADRRYQEVLAATLSELGGRLADLGDLMPYAPGAGLARHREAAAAWLGHNDLEVPPERVIMTGGAHQAIVVALAALLRPGDPLLAESLSYSGLLSITGALHLRIEGVAMDEQGMRPDALDAACRSSGARVVFTNPTLHNPTVCTMPAGRREEIVAVARRHDVILVEDDVYGLLRRERPPAFAVLAPERTLYVSSASKTVAPGLRLGLLVGPAALHDRLADTKYDFLLSQPALLPEIFALWVANGTAERLLERQREEAAARQRLAAEILGGLVYRTDPCSFHIWLPLPAPWRDGDFTLAARERGVIVAAGQSFAVGRSHAPSAVRISLSSAGNREHLRRALAILRMLMDETPRPRRGVI